MATTEINGSKVRVAYRASGWTRSYPIRLFVTSDDKIWIGCGQRPDRLSHVANVGDNGSGGYTRRAVRIAANS